MSAVLGRDPGPEQLVAVAAELWTQRLGELVVRQGQSLGGVLLRGARPVPVGANGTTRPSTSDGSLVGYALRETSGNAVADVELRQGDGTLICPVNLAAGATAVQWFAPGGINYADGLTLTVVSGAVDGSVFLRAGDT